MKDFSRPTSSGTNRPPSRFNMSIQGRLFLLLAAILIPILAIEANIYYHRFRTMRQQGLETNLAVARSTGEFFNAFLKDVLLQEKTLGMTLTSPEPMHAEQMNRVLAVSKAEYLALCDLAWLSPDGYVIASTMANRIGSSVADRPYFIEIETGSDQYVSDLFQARTIGRPIFAITRAVRKESGELLGVVYAAIEPERLGEVLASASRHPGTITIFDGSRNTVFRLPAGESQAVDAEQLANAPQAARAFERRESRTAMIPGPNGKIRAVALTPVATAPGWMICVDRPEEEVLKPIYSDLRRDAALFLAVSFLAFLAALAISHAIASPVKKLRERALALADGRLGGRLRVGGASEIRELASAFDTMASSLRANEIEHFLHLMRMRTLVDVSARIMTENNIEALLPGVIEVACEITGAEFAMAELDRDGGRVLAVACSGGGDETVPAPADPSAIEKLGIYNELTEGGTALRLTKDELERRPDRDELLGWHPALRGFLGIPLRDSDGRSSGALIVTNRMDGDFTTDDEAFLTQLATSASLGMQQIRAHDAAEHRAAEAEESRRILEAMMEHIPEGITIADAQDGVIRMVSRYGRELSALTTGNVSGSPVRDLWKGFDPRKADGLTPARAEDMPLVRALLTGEAVIDEELLLKGPDGEAVPILCRAVPIRDGEGHITGGVLAWRDITLIKAAQEVLRKSHEELEQRVRERTAELARANEALQAEIKERMQAEEALRESAARLENSNRELQNFASVASHDLQEPLRKIRSFSERLVQKYSDVLDDTGRDYLERMSGSAARMQAFIEALLDYARVTTKAEPFVPVDLNGVIREVLGDLELAIERKKARVELERLPLIEADPHQMRQLFQNLLGNALKFSGPSQPSLKIYGRSAGPSASGKGPGDPVLQIFIEDNGIGFDEQYLDRIFMLFQRLHGRSAFEGTGMGLAICKKIVERHGGSITARGKPGEGATFIVTLPIYRIGSADAQAEGPAKRDALGQ